MDEVGPRGKIRPAPNGIEIDLGPRASRPGPKPPPRVAHTAPIVPLRVVDAIPAYRLATPSRDKVEKMDIGFAPMTARACMRKINKALRDSSTRGDVVTGWSGVWT